MKLHLTRDELRFHLRCALLIVAGSAFATFVGFVLLQFQGVQVLVEGQRGANADARRLQAQLDTRIRGVQAKDDDARLALETKLKDLESRQNDAEEQRKASIAKAPFPIEGVMASIVEIVCIDNRNRDVYYTGSGTVIDKSGVILTNRHVLVSDDGSLIKLCGVGFTADLSAPPKIEYVASLRAEHDGTDLAVLRIDERLDKKGAPPKEFPSITLADARRSSVALDLGDPIFIGGYPGIGADTFTFTQGVVSGRVGTELLKTSALIDSGTSGGAAFDAAGRYVGVPTAAAKGDIGGSLGYLITGATVDSFLADYYAGRNLVK
jgi:S1-C subfamily serine protease